jgi:transposase
MKHPLFRVGHGPQRNQSKEQFWRQTLKAFAASGQSIRAFCAAKRLTEPSFYARRRALPQRDATRSEPASSTSPVPAFVPVHLAEAMGSSLDIVLTGDCCIRLHGPVDRAALVEVVAVLDVIERPMERNLKRPLPFGTSASHKPLATTRSRCHRTMHPPRLDSQAVWARPAHGRQGINPSLLLQRQRQQFLRVSTRAFFLQHRFPCGMLHVDGDRSIFIPRHHCRPHLT